MRNLSPSLEELSVPSSSADCRQSSRRGNGDLGDDAINALEAEEDVAGDIVRNCSRKFVKVDTDLGHSRFQISHSRAKGVGVGLAFWFNVG
jgi:hypothetical protein